MKNVNEKATLGKLVADGRDYRQVASYKATCGNSSEPRAVAIKAFTLLSPGFICGQFHFLLGLSGSCSSWSQSSAGAAAFPSEF